MHSNRIGGVDADAPILSQVGDVEVKKQKSKIPRAR